MWIQYVPIALVAESLVQSVSNNPILRYLLLCYRVFATRLKWTEHNVGPWSQFSAPIVLSNRFCVGTAGHCHHRGRVGGGASLFPRRPKSRAVSSLLLPLPHSTYLFKMAQSYTPFQRYDEEFKSLKKQVRDSLQDDDDEEQANHTSNLLSQCEELLQQMALEARSVSDASLKRELLAQVRTYKSEWQKLKDDYNKKALLAGANGSGSANIHRDRLLKQQDMLLNQNSQLENARKVLEETEQVALEIGAELSHNRETIESAHGRVRSVAGLTGRARRVLSSMSQRQTQQKMILYGLAGGVIVFFLLVLWWMH